MAGVVGNASEAPPIRPSGTFSPTVKFDVFFRSECGGEGFVGCVLELRKRQGEARFNPDSQDLVRTHHAVPR
jgi:hypothetical protein